MDLWKLYSVKWNICMRWNIALDFQTTCFDEADAIKQETSMRTKIDAHAQFGQEDIVALMLGHSNILLIKPHNTATHNVYIYLMNNGIDNYN